MKPGPTPKLTQATLEKIGELLFLAFTDPQIAFYLGISQKTLASWRKLEAFSRAKKIEMEWEIPMRHKVWNSTGYWQGAAWYLERKYPAQFAKPEIQLSLNNSFTQNNLSISLSSPEAKVLEAEAVPVRAAVAGMFEKYRPAGNGNGNGA